MPVLNADSTCTSAKDPTRCQSNALVTAVHPSHIDVKVTRTVCRGCDGRCLGLSDTSNSIRLRKSLLGTEKIDLCQGDSITLSVPASMLIGLSSLVYLLPVVLMLLFAIACDVYLEGSELATAGAALGGLSVGILVCRRATVRLSQRLRSQFSVTPNQ